LDVSIHKQTEEIGERCGKMIEEIDVSLEGKEWQVPEYRPLVVPMPASTMPGL